MSLKITAVCCTHNRPQFLPYALWMFQQQTYPNKELLIFDDAVQYDDQQGENWRLVSHKKRFRSLGHKRNVAIGLSALDTDAVAVWDDDDLYYPWALSVHARALDRAVWSRPSLVWDTSLEWRVPTILAETVARDQANWIQAYHGSWAYKKKEFLELGGYDEDYAGDRDTNWVRPMVERHGLSADPLAEGSDPFYVYCYWHPPVRFNDTPTANEVFELSQADKDRWGKPEWVGRLVPKAVPDYLKKLHGPRVPWADRLSFKK